MRSQKSTFRLRPLVSVFVWKGRFFSPVFLPSTQIRWKRSLKAHLFKTTPQIEEFLKRRFAVLMWMGVVQELLVRSLLIGRRKQWNVILPTVLVLFGVRETHHWWLLFLGWMKTEVFETITSRCWISVNAHAATKDDTVFTCYCIFVSTRKHDYRATIVTGVT